MAEDELQAPELVTRKVWEWRAKLPGLAAAEQLQLRRYVVKTCCAACGRASAAAFRIGGSVWLQGAKQSEEGLFTILPWIRLPDGWRLAGTDRLLCPSSECL